LDALLTYVVLEPFPLLFPKEAAEYPSASERERLALGIAARGIRSPVEFFGAAASMDDPTVLRVAYNAYAISGGMQSQDVCAAFVEALLAQRKMTPKRALDIAKTAAKEALGSRYDENWFDGHP